MVASKLFLAIATIGLALPAQAAPMTFEFSGQVTRLELSSCCLTHGEVFDGVVVVGDAFSGRFRYDSEAELFQITTSNFSIYRDRPPEFDVEISIGSTFATARDVVPFLSQFISVGVTDAFSGFPGGTHFFNVNASISPTRGVLPANSPGAGFLLELEDLSASVFTSADLPTALSLDDFSSATLRLQANAGGIPGSFWTVHGRIDSLVLIPEPGTLPLALPAIIALIACRRLARWRVDLLPESRRS